MCKVKRNVLVDELRSLSFLSDKGALECLGLSVARDPASPAIIPQSILSALHNFQSSTSELLLAIQKDNHFRRFVEASKKN